jgi:hypothetical protein
MTDFSDADKLKSLKRELALRERVYPKRVEDGRMGAVQAAHELDIMRAIIADYEERLMKL